MARSVVAEGPRELRGAHRPPVPGTPGPPDTGQELCAASAP